MPLVRKNITFLLASRQVFTYPRVLRIAPRVLQRLHKVPLGKFYVPASVQIAPRVLQRLSKTQIFRKFRSPARLAAVLGLPEAEFS